MTHGEWLVGLEFNPSASPQVTDLKTKAAAFIDAVMAIESPVVPEVARLKALAITNAEQAAMWAVKAVTKRPQT